MIIKNLTEEQIVDIIDDNVLEMGCGSRDRDCDRNRDKCDRSRDRDRDRCRDRDRGTDKNFVDEIINVDDIAPAGCSIDIYNNNVIFDE